MLRFPHTKASRPGPLLLKSDRLRLSRAYPCTTHYRLHVDAPPERKLLRQSMRERRRALPAAERIAAATQLSERLDALAELHTDARIAGYWASDGELPLAAVLPKLMGRGAHFHLPVILGARATALAFAPWRAGQPIRANRFGIPEPEYEVAQLVSPQLMQCVLMPLVAFDRRGHRLGMGGGYYDASFEFLRFGERPREPLLVGIAYAFQEVPHIEPKPHDVHLDFVCTERELIDCTVPS